MTVSENLGQELFNYLLYVFLAIIVYFAWRSTNVREDRLPPAAFYIIDNNRRRYLELISRQSATRVRSSSSLSNYSNVTEEFELENDQSPSPRGDISNSEASTSQTTNGELLSESGRLQQNRSSEVHRTDSLQAVEEERVSSSGSENDPGPQDIIADMDNPDTPEGLRRRRLAFYEGEQSRQTTSFDLNATLIEPSAPSEEIVHEPDSQVSAPRIRRENLNLQTESYVDNSHAENCSNENNENESISKTIAGESTITAEKGSTEDKADKEDELRIKLKYLNDDLRLVRASPNEAIGDFKKRNFTVEIATQKLVRLVFNGHVLQPDSKTLQACGLFDNCVVHCLIHNKKPTSTVTSDSSRNGQNRDQRENVERYDLSDLLDESSDTSWRIFTYIFMSILTIAIIFCWYCRIQYSYLFTWNSTSGLIHLTILLFVGYIIFIIM